MATAKTPSASIISRSYQCRWRRCSRPSSVSSDSNSPAIGASRLERDVVVLLPGVGGLLVLQTLQGPHDPPAGAAGDDHIVEIAVRGGDERVGEVVAIVVLALRQLLGIAQVGAEDDLHRLLGSHHRDLRGGPGVVQIAAD